MELQDILQISGMAVRVAEAAAELKEYLESFDQETMHWWTVYNSEEYAELLDAIDDYEELRDELAG